VLLKEKRTAVANAEFEAEQRYLETLAHLPGKEAAKYRAMQGAVTDATQRCAAPAALCVLRVSLTASRRLSLSAAHSESQTHFHGWPWCCRGHSVLCGRRRVMDVCEASRLCGRWRCPGRRRRRAAGRSEGRRALDCRPISACSRRQRRRCWPFRACSAWGAPRPGWRRARCFLMQRLWLQLAELAEACQSTQPSRHGQWLRRAPIALASLMLCWIHQG
jgi:hypothetical protein